MAVVRHGECACVGPRFCWIVGPAVCLMAFFSHGSLRLRTYEFRQAMLKPDRPYRTVWCTWASAAEHHKRRSIICSRDQRTGGSHVRGQRIDER